MAEGELGAGKVLGMPRKTAYWVIGGGALFAVVVLWMRSRQGAPASLPAPVGPIGGGGGAFVTGPSPQEQLGLAQANLALREQQQMAFQRERLGELEIREREARVSGVESGLQLERQYGESILPGLIGRRQAEEEAMRQAALTARVSEERLTAEAGKAPVKCPPGMHPANVPGVGLTCRQLGDPGGGRGFQPFRQIGNIFGGLLTGAAQAAPGIGAGAAYYGAAQAGVLPQPRQATQRVERIGTRSGVFVNEPIQFTPGINPAGQGPSYNPFTVSYPWEIR